MDEVKYPHWNEEDEILAGVIDSWREVVAMFQAVDAPAKTAFGVYEVDLQTGELWKAGRRIKIQTQPFKVLAALLERPDEIVTRDELQLRVWGPDTTVDFDHSLGTAINKIREALGDSAENPRFVETLARRGYRFIAPVTHPAQSVSIAEPSIAGSHDLSGVADQSDTSRVAVVPAVQPARITQARRRIVAGSAVSAGLIAATAIGFFLEAVMNLKFKSL